jgi:UDP-glucose:glycoprotein glucosyltransferase
LTTCEECQFYRAEQIYDAAARHAESNETLQVLKLSLGIRKYSPRLEMFRALASAGAAAHCWHAAGEEGAPMPCCWAEMGGAGGDGAHVALASTQAELDAMIASAARSTPADKTAATTVPHASALDHVYPAAAAAAAAPAVVFYGAVGTPCFAGFHASLKAAAISGAVAYVHRPVLVPGCERDGCVGLGATSGGGKAGGERLTVAGFGVEMAVKNMEYKATDDTEIKDTSAGAGAGAGGGAELSSEDVKGFNFARLAERYPALAPELTSFRDHLVAMDSEDEATLKVWDIKDLGLQATQRIALASDPLQMMVDISQNFPSLASSLSRMELDPDVRAEVGRCTSTPPDP